MKLLIQSDDFGITRAVSQGCIFGIQNGVIKNTGMFTNMPWIEECVFLLKPYINDIAFGIDLNLSTGSSLLSHSVIPNLTKLNGQFLTSYENRQLDCQENGFDHLADFSGQVYDEFKAQIEKYIQLVGKKPDYIHNHAYGTATIDTVTKRLAKEYDVICTLQLMEKNVVKQAGMGWYMPGDAQSQLSGNLTNYIIEDKGKLIGSEYGYLISHCGYLDAEIFQLSSFNTCRAMDLQALTSNDVKEWIENNQIELITFKELPDSWKK